MSKIQVDKDYYLTQKYASIERFISYFLQIKFLRDFKDKKILFIGVGDGLVPHYLKNVLNLQITTLDIDPDLKPDVVGDMQFLPFKDDEFDVIVAYEVLEHLPFEEFEKILAELSRVSTHHVILSLPHRHTGFDFVFKFPFIRSIFSRDFVRIAFSIPIKFPGFAVSKQHYWEIESKKTKLKDIRKKLFKYFHIVKEDRAMLDAYRHFFVLQNKKMNLRNSFVRDYYDQFLQDLDSEYTKNRWQSSPANLFDYKQTKNAIKRVLSSDKKNNILEIGLGDGTWTPEVLPLAQKLVLLDQSEEMMKRAKERLKDHDNTEYVHNDFLKFETENKFDLIFSVRCFEYFEDQTLAIQKMNNLLEKEGRVILVTKNKGYISFAERRGKLLHTKMLGKRELRKIFKDAGFKIEHIFSATLRVKSKYRTPRLFFSLLHKLHVATFGIFTVPWLFDKLTESYIYVAKKK